ncbi:MAG: hypothetical protein WHV44_14030 [Anaerolineales bacterium]
MNTSSSCVQGQPETQPSPIFDPFPEPRAYPSGWDLSEIHASLPQSFGEEAPHH